MKIVLIFLVAIISYKSTSAQSLIVTGTTWDVNPLSSSTIITKAGKNYETAETSSASLTTLKVSGIVLNTVSVQQVVGSSWDPALVLSVKRTGSGSGLALILGSTDFVVLSSSVKQFFTVALSIALPSKDGITIQYQISGLSVLLPAKTYTTTVMYTVSGL